ncbi:MAG: YbdD/YjiX family protein [Rothia sp. (in: high G+C Gram-positive bacteria)]|nr:YbdD/YjiX family protein [Rothia sp. (in: high G+C Gram-positive bacteria)]
MKKLRELFSTVSWFANGVLGADKYQKYLAYHRQSGCTEAPMSEREFWRDVSDRQERNPGARCC